MSVYESQILFMGVILSFLLGLGLAALFKYTNQRDAHCDKRRSAHRRPTSRLGGVAVCVAIVIMIFSYNETVHFEFAISALPVFLVGIAEDLGRPQKPKFRLAIGAFSAALFIAFEERVISSVGFEWGNFILSSTPLAVLFTIF